MRGAAWAVILCAAAGTGCLYHRPDGSVGLANPFAGRPGPGPANPAAVARSLGPAVPAEGFYVESVLLERPVGDEVLDRQLWAAEQTPVPPETAALLTENGLRVAVLRGALPPVFQKLLDTEADTVNPRGLTFAGRKEFVIPTAGPTDPCEYEVLTDLAGRRTAVKLRQAACGFLVRPEPAADGRVRVRCEPQLQHGDRRGWLRPSADGTQFTMQEEVPTVRYPGLGFEVLLGPNDYLLVGWPAAMGNTLGSVLFGVEANNQPRQRVLVVRAGRLGDPTPSDLPAIRGPRGRPSIAAEAGRK
jgi:hypothetical protein